MAKALQEKHRLEEQLKRKDDGSLFDLKNDTAEHIAAAIVDNISGNKAALIGRRILDRFKRKEQKPAG